MSGIPFMSFHIDTEISSVLLGAFFVFGCWCVGRLRLWLQPSQTLVGRVTEAKFVALLRQAGLERRLAATTYRYLQESGRLGELNVAPLPGDHLLWDLGLNESQVEQAVADLARRLHRQRSAESLSRLPSTVEDLAHLLQLMPPVEVQSTSRAA